MMTNFSSIIGWICTLLRNSALENARGVRSKGCIKKIGDEAQSKRKNDPGNKDSSVVGS